MDRTQNFQRRWEWRNLAVVIFIFTFFYSGNFYEFWVLIFFIDVAEEHERLELRSRTEVRMTEGETEESVIYKFTGKAAQS